MSQTDMGKIYLRFSASAVYTREPVPKMVSLGLKQCADEGPG